MHTLPVAAMFAEAVTLYGNHCNLWTKCVGSTPGIQTISAYMQVDYYQLFDQVRFKYNLVDGTWQEVEINP
jgi:hypothetical protein